MPVEKTNQELLIEIQKSIYSLHRRQDEYSKKLDLLYDEFIEFKKSMPTRKSGWLSDYWEIKT